MELGQRIRGQRQRLHLTLNELASRSGISRAMISGVERGDRSPTVRVLCQIAAGLECSVSSLIDAGSVPGARIVRANERSRFVDGETGAIRELLSPGLLDRGFELLRYEIPPGKTVGPFPPAAMDTMEHITLMSGRVDCTVDGEMHALRAGDSRVDLTGVDCSQKTGLGRFEVVLSTILEAQSPGHGRRSGVNRGIWCLAE